MVKWLPPFWKSLFTLVTGRALGQVVAFLALPVLTRIYVPDAFGIAAIFVAFSATLAVVLNGGYEFTIMLPGASKESKILIGIASRIALIIVGVFSLIIVFVGPSVAAWQNFAWGPLWQWGLPVSLLLEGLTKPLRVYANRLTRYRDIAISRFMRSFSQVVVSLTWGLTLGTFQGLILGFLASQLGEFLVLSRIYFPFSFSTLRKQDAASIRGMRRTYAHFPRYSILTGFLTTASKQLPFFMLPWLFAEGVSVNGLFSKSDQILLVPIGLVSMSVGNVFFEEASGAWRKGQAALGKVTWDTLLRLAALGLIPYLALLFWGPELFSWVLGSNWEQAGYYAQWLAPSMYLLFVTTPLTYLVDIRQKLQAFLLLTIVLFGLRFGALWFGGEWLDSTQTIQVFALVNGVAIFIQLLFLIQLGGLWTRLFAKGQS